jgi:hypothetical protein
VCFSGGGEFAYHKAPAKTAASRLGGGRTTRGDAFTQELLAFCKAGFKVPRSSDYEEELPGLPTGKLYRRLLRARDWGKKDSRIV